MHDILDVINNVESIYSTNSNLAVLKDFERVLDEMDMYVYKNWIDGELARGPIVERHWITASFMWPREKMPDPTAAKRLTALGCKVKYGKTFLVEPRKIKDPDDIRPGTRKGKLDHQPIWMVEIMMPKKLAADIYEGYMTKLREEIGIGRNSKIDGSVPEAADVQAAAQTPQATPAAAGGEANAPA
jgi:hypothetical protein